MSAEMTDHVVEQDPEDFRRAELRLLGNETPGAAEATLTEGAALADRSTPEPPEDHIMTNEELLKLAGDEGGQVLTPLNQLLQRAMKFKLLEAAQEIDLAKKIERGNLDAKELLINSNLRLVVSVAKWYRNHGLPMEDLVQEGMLGLVRAAEKYDYRKGYRFSTYAVIWIRQALQRGLDNTGRTIRVPSHMSQKIRTLARVERELNQELGRPPTLMELAAGTGIEPALIDFLQKRDIPPTSLNQPVGDEQGAEIGDLLPRPASVEEEFFDRERETVLRKVLKEVLTDVELDLVVHRNKLFGKPEQSCAIIGRRHGLGREAATARYRTAMEKLEMPTTKKQLEGLI